MLLQDVAEASAALTDTRSRRDKRDRLAALLLRASLDEVPLIVAYLSGELTQGRIGLGPAAVEKARQTPPASTASLQLVAVARAFDDIATAAGRGSQALREQRLFQLFAGATAAEQHFLARLIVGELRQGALEGVMLDAIAMAARVPLASLRRAAMLRGDLSEVARVAMADKEAGLARFSLVVGRPISPMLAQSADGIEEALTRLGEASLEHKLDGARVQLHKDGAEVRVFSRGLHDVTERVPELVELGRALPARSLVLDGEAIALTEGGAPRPFQQTMRRFGRRLDVERMRAELPLSALFFDLLHLEGEDLLDERAEERARALAALLPASSRIPRIERPTGAEAARFVEDALARGHEGVVAKALSSTYEAGRRGVGWVKVKPTHTLDLLVLAAEWGSGRRQGLLSNLHLGARDEASGGYVMLGKTFKGMTDEMLRAQTERFLALAAAREGHVVSLPPAVVVEVVFDGLQESSQYEGGLALRFARVKRYRPDKGPLDVDTLASVRALYAAQH